MWVLKRNAREPLASLQRRMPLALVGLLCVWLAGCAQSASQSGYAIPIDLRCTTCNDFLRCTSPAQPAVPAQPALAMQPVAPKEAAADVVYRLGEKSFWAQVATIGDYLTQLASAKTTDERPLTVYRIADARWRSAAVGLARIDIVAAQIALSETGGAQASIDQRTGRLSDAGAGAQCVVMPRREGFALVRQVLGRPMPAAPAPMGAPTP